MSPRQKACNSSQGYDSSTSSAGDQSPFNSNTSDIYRLKRDRNNVAVKKSREKSRRKNKETAEKMAMLREENFTLETRIEELSQELVNLKKELLRKVSGSKPSEANVSESQKTKPRLATISSQSSIASPYSDFYEEPAQNKPISHSNSLYNVNNRSHSQLPDPVVLANPRSVDQDHQYF